MRSRVNNLFGLPRGIEFFELTTFLFLKIYWNPCGIQEYSRKALALKIGNPEPIFD
jgi:hypothetical protein